MNPKRNLWKGLLVCLVLFFSINLASSTLFRKARLDLTESGLFTLSDGTRAILEGMEDDVTLRFYFSKSMANDLTDLRDYARRVEELLVEYQSIAGPRLDVQIIEPEPFSPQHNIIGAHCAPSPRARAPRGSAREKGVGDSTARPFTE